MELLIIKYLTGSIEAKDLNALQQWIDASPENRKLFNSLKDMWNVSDQQILYAEGLEDSWDSFKNKLELSENKVPGQKSKKAKMLRTLRLAASWLLFFTAGSAITWFVSNKQKEIPDRIIEIAAPLGSRSQVKMSDGTIIWLNAGTTLTYNESYGRETRTLNLTGEAYFDVAKDKSHPFIVNTSGLVIRALGTRFNIKAYPDEKTISATLEEGQINVSVLGKKVNNKPVILKEKGKIIFLKETMNFEDYSQNADELIFENMAALRPQQSEMKNMNILTHVNTELYTSWKDPRWIIQGEQLGILARVLERRFNLQIVFNDEELKKYKFSGIIENETVDQIMELLRLTAPLEYAINKDTIVLTLNITSSNEFGKIITRQ